MLHREGASNNQEASRKWNNTTLQFILKPMQYSLLKITLVEKKNTNLARILQDVLQDLARQCIFLAGFLQDSCKIYIILQDSCKKCLILRDSCKMKL